MFITEFTSHDQVILDFVTRYIAEQEAIDRSALVVLDQHIRDAAAGREDLASEAAEAIAMMEADRDDMREARSVFAKEIAGCAGTSPASRTGQRTPARPRNR